MKLLPHFLIIGLLFVFLLGGSAVKFNTDHDHINSNKNCIISTIQGSFCPEGNSPFFSASFHINILKNAVIGIFSRNSELNPTELFFILTLLFVTVMAVFILPSNLDRKIFNYFLLIRRKIPTPSQQKFRVWLSLYEKRGPALSSQCRN